MHADSNKPDATQPVAYRILRKTVDGAWKGDSRGWWDGLPNRELADDIVKRSDGWRIEYAYGAPSASNVDVSILLAFIFERFGQPGDAGELPANVVAAVRRLEAAPQASEAQCPRCALPLCQECNCDEGYTARAELQASEAVCSCPTGDGSLRHPCAVHPRASEASIDDAENVRTGHPFNVPAFEALCREHDVWGRASSALCAVFWRAALSPTQPTEQGER